LPRRGAKQAALLGLRGIAFSAPATEKEQPDFELLKPWVGSVLEMLLAIPDLCLVNVNFPPSRPARHALDTAVAAPLRRTRRADQGSHEPHALLVR